jgi:hypothetical protein
MAQICSLYPGSPCCIKSFDEDTEWKAANFEEKALQSFLIKKDTTYWEVRQAITITAYFGGLQPTECLDLKLEQIIRSEECYTITHTRAKQRMDKTSTKFLVPEAGGYTSQLADYLKKVNNQPDKFQGRV